MFGSIDQRVDSTANPISTASGSDLRSKIMKGPVFRASRTKVIAITGSCSSRSLALSASPRSPELTIINRGKSAPVFRNNARLHPHHSNVRQRNRNSTGRADVLEKPPAGIVISRPL